MKTNFFILAIFMFFLFGLKVNAQDHYLSLTPGLGTATNAIRHTGTFNLGGDNSISAQMYIYNSSSHGYPALTINNNGSVYGTQIYNNNTYPTLFITQGNGNGPALFIQANGQDIGYDNDLVFGHKLSAIPSSTWTERVRLTSAGNLIIGTSSAAGSLTVNGTTSISTDLTVGGNIGSGTNNLTLTTNGTTRMTINNSTGNVGIGTAPTSNRLTVCGTIVATELKIEAITGCDFVFEDNYKRASLQEVEQYVKENKHLPGIASAAEMKANGVSIGDLNMQLLQKVEELTLYMIEINKENQRLACENAQIKEQLQQIISK